MIEATGERYLPSMGGIIQAEHLHRYLFAKTLCHDRLVLDIACGEGYGTDMLAETAGHVWGIDLDPAVIGHANEKYRNEKLTFIRGSITDIPLETASVDVVVSFETIEHLTGHEMALSEIRRVLKPDGILLMSSPDKRHYSDEPAYRNEYHLKELYKEEFINLISNHFSRYRLFSQQFMCGSLIFGEESAGSAIFHEADNSPGTAVSAHSTLPAPLYHLLLAGNGPLPAAGNSVFIISNPLEEDNKRLRMRLEQVLQSRSFRLGTFLLAPFRLIRNSLR